MPKRKAAATSVVEPAAEIKRGPRGIVNGGKKNKKKKSKTSAKSSGKGKAAEIATATKSGGSGGDSDEGVKELPTKEQNAIVKELQGIINEFNYDTDSELSEPEGLSDIEDDL